jgi:hypothetical protein
MRITFVQASHASYRIVRRVGNWYADWSLISDVQFQAEHSRYLILASLFIESMNTIRVCP